MVYARPYGRALLIIGGLMLIFAVLQNSLPLLLRRAVDVWLLKPVEGQPSANVRGLFFLALLYLFIAVVSGAGRYIQGVMSARVGQSILRSIRADVFSKAMRLSLDYYNYTPVGKLVTRVTSDVDVLQQFVTDGMVGAVADCFMFAGVAGFMFYLNPLLAGVLFVVLPLSLSLLTLANWRLHQANRDIRTAQASLNARLQESITGMTTIQMFGQESRICDSFSDVNGELLNANLREVKWFSFYFPVIELSQALGAVLVLVFGVYSMQHGGSVTVGMIVAFLAYLREFFRPIESLSDKAGLYQQARASCERVFELLDTKETVSDVSDPRVLPDPPRGSVNFNHVWFAYKQEDWILRDVTFSIREGENAAIVGATGAGKSTIIQLISRFYDAQRGQVLFDGMDVKTVAQATLRHRIAIVPQEPFIFSGSILDNIRLNDTGIPSEKVIMAAKHVHAHGFISRMPNGYGTLCGERGTRLSTGQKQLLALARAFLLNECSLLILDEATASVDSETEQCIMQALQALSKDRSTITIAHRLSTIRHADRILVMQHGEIIARGVHEELMDHCAYYNRLYRLLVEEQVSL